jgi:hypothetical protein
MDSKLTDKSINFLGCRPLEKLIFAELVKKFPTFMEAVVSLGYSWLLS